MSYEAVMKSKDLDCGVLTSTTVGLTHRYIVMLYYKYICGWTKLSGNPSTMTRVQYCRLRIVYLRKEIDRFDIPSVFKTEVAISSFLGCR